MSELHLTYTVDRDTERTELVRLALTGELDLDSSLRLQADVDELVEAGGRELVFDLSDLSFIDSTGLSFLLHVRKQLAAVDGVLVLADVSAPVTRVLRISGLHRLLLAPEPVDAVAER